MNSNALKSFLSNSNKGSARPQGVGASSSSSATGGGVSGTSVSTSGLREKVVALQKLVAQKITTAGAPATTPTNDDNDSQTKTKKYVEMKKKEKKENKVKAAAAGQKALSDFMRAVGEPITFVETREIWNDMCSTNNGAFPRFETAFLDISHHTFCKRNMLLKPLDESSECIEQDSDRDREDSKIDENSVECGEAGGRSSEFATDITEQDVSRLSGEEFVHFARDLAKGIKTTYSIRAQDDNSELKFISCTVAFLWTVVGSIAIAGYYYSENTKIGTFTVATLPMILTESFILFAVELVWECFLSWIVLRFNIKVNYTRKLGNLLKVPKYFIADLIPAFTSTALSMTTAIAINQTLFCLMYYRKSRERVPFFAYVFLSQDRREDRPDTLIFQVTEDIMRFAIYLPFKLLVVDLIQSKAIIFIPIAVNNIGDGLAEPVGVAFGKHKYSTTALYHKGRFFHSKFTRSYEGSSCVFITTAIVVAANYHAFNTTQFWITFSILPFLMTIGEAKAPHTNDGPFLALIGCSFLSAIFLIGR